VTKAALTRESSLHGTLATPEQVVTDDVLGHIAWLNNEWTLAQKQFQKGYDVAAAVVLSFQFGMALDNHERSQARRGGTCERSSPEDEEKLREFRHAFENKLRFRVEDAYEQEAHRDILKPEEEDDEEEREMEVEVEAEAEEEAAGTDRGDPPNDSKPEKESP
jgi:hypothetical protein